jgi:glycosyltransferase involved in cell wall biosynthesis
VSVVIPCYNYGHFLPDAVGSVLDQPGVDVDVLVVDDASPDGSVEVARKLAAADPRVRVLAHQTNKGHIATYNDGLAEVDGDYVVLLSADDLLTPGSLARSTALLEAHPEVGLVYGWAQSFTDHPPQPRTVASSWSVWGGDRWIDHLCRTGRNVVTNPEVVLRRDVMAQLRGYDPAFPHAADLDLWLRAAQLGDVGRVNGSDQAFYRAHGGNMHLTDYAGMLRDLTERRAVFDRVAPTGADSIRDRARSAAVHRALAREAMRLAWAAHDGDGSHSGETAEEFRGFALDTWPGVVRTPLWQALRYRAARTSPGWQVSVSRAYRRARVHLWWLWTRRVGL